MHEVDNTMVEYKVKYKGEDKEDNMYEEEEEDDDNKEESNVYKEKDVYKEEDNKNVYELEEGVL